MPPPLPQTQVTPLRAQGAMLMLAAAEIYDSPQPLTLFPALTPEEWESLFTEARRQTLTGICANALSLLPDGPSPPPAHLLARLAAGVHSIEAAYTAHADALRTLTEAWHSAGIRPLLLKGLSAARYYPHPRLRIGGDIDLYIAPAQWQAALQLLQRGRIGHHRAPDGSVAYSTAGGITVELHPSALDLNWPPRRRAALGIIARAGVAKADVAPGTVADIPGPLAELLLYNTHILKHLLGSGIGLRQVCDYAAAWQALAVPGTPLETEYLDACRSLGLVRWTDTLHRFVNTHLPPPSGPLPVMLGRPVPHADERMLGAILTGGNFGLYTRGHADGSVPSGRNLASRLATLRAIVSHSRLGLDLAPTEALAYTATLACGQRLH